MYDADNQKNLMSDKRTLNGNNRRVQFIEWLLHAKYFALIFFFIP